MIKELELTQCLEVLQKHYIGHLGFISGRHPYIIPITYFYNAEEKCILSYSAMGHKIQAMRSYEQVALHVEEIESVQRWRSVLVHGNFEELEGSTAKKYLHMFAQGVMHRMKGEKPQFIQDFSNRLLRESPPIVYRIHVSDITGKCRER